MTHYDDDPDGEYYDDDEYYDDEDDVYERLPRASRRASPIAVTVVAVFAVLGILVGLQVAGVVIGVLRYGQAPGVVGLALVVLAFRNLRQPESLDWFAGR